MIRNANVAFHSSSVAHCWAMVHRLKTSVLDSGGYSADSDDTETAMANIHIKHHSVSYRVHY